MEAIHHILTDGRELVIREATGRDAPALLDFIEVSSAESTYLSFCPGEFELTEEEERNYLEQSRIAATSLYLVGEVGGQIVTTLSFASRDRQRIRHCGEFGMSVRAIHWGQGIGGCILDALLAWAKASKFVSKVQLRVRTDNERAIKLDKSRSFEIEGTLLGDFLVDGVYHDHHMMALVV